MNARHRLTLVPFALVLGFAGALALAGCSGNGSPLSPNLVTSQADADDVALQAGIAFDNLGAIVNAGVSSGAPSGPVSLRAGGYAPQSTGGGFATLTDTTFSRGDITFQLSRRWFSVTHVEQTVPDGTTDSVVVTSRVFGTDSTSLTSARYQVTIGHAGQLRAGGLIALRPVATLEGAWTDTLDSRFRALASAERRTFYARSLGVANGIRVPKTGSGYPTAGTIVWTIHAQRTRNGDRADVEKRLDAVVTLTFNGTRYPTVIVNGTWSYQLDLETGAVVRAGTL